MDKYEILLSVILVLLIVAFACIAGALSELEDVVRRTYMSAASDHTVRNAKKEILTEMNDQFDKVITEIACLAVKNNADIQRVREGYKPGDVIEYDGDQYMVLKINHVSTDLGRTIDVYRLYNVANGEMDGADRDEVDKNSKLLRHVDLGLEDKQ